MASLSLEKLHPFIPAEDYKFPRTEVGGGMKLLQYYYFSKAFYTCSYHGTTTEHLSEEQFCHIKLNEFLLRLSALRPIKAPHMAAPAHKNALRKELWSKLCWSWWSGQRTRTIQHRAAHPGVCSWGKEEVSWLQLVGVDFSSAPSYMSSLMFPSMWNYVYMYLIHFNDLL